MKELTVTDTRITIEGEEGGAFTHALINLDGAGSNPGRTPAMVFGVGVNPIEINTAAQAGELARLFERIHSALEEHERQLALKDAAKAL
jgi:hypothetical protein